MAGNKAQLSLKLLVDTKENKVLFAEAGKEFVDFIFHMMSLPLGAIVKLLKTNKMVGCLGDLYKSVESLNTQYFHSDVGKKSVLNPKPAVNVPLLSLKKATTTASDAAVNVNQKLYRCDSGCKYVTNLLDDICPQCDNDMYLEMSFVRLNEWVDTASSSSGSEEGYVKGVVTYMVMDNLEVKPMSTISGITLINKFNVKDVSSLAEMEVQLGLKEGLAILKASMETKAVLTLVFLGNKI